MSALHLCIEISRQFKTGADAVTTVFNTIFQRYLADRKEHTMLERYFDSTTQRIETDMTPSTVQLSVSDNTNITLYSVCLVTSNAAILKLVRDALIDDPDSYRDLPEDCQAMTPAEQRKYFTVMFNVKQPYAALYKALDRSNSCEVIEFLLKETEEFINYEDIIHQIHPEFTVGYNTEDNEYLPLSKYFKSQKNPKVIKLLIDHMLKHISQKKLSISYLPDILVNVAKNSRLDFYDALDDLFWQLIVELSGTEPIDVVSPFSGMTVLHAYTRFGFTRVDAMVQYMYDFIAKFPHLADVADKTVDYIDTRRDNEKYYTTINTNDPDMQFMKTKYGKTPIQYLADNCGRFNAPNYLTYKLLNAGANVNQLYGKNEYNLFQLHAQRELYYSNVKNEEFIRLLNLLVHCINNHAFKWQHKAKGVLEELKSAFITPPSAAQATTIDLSLWDMYDLYTGSAYCDAAIARVQKDCAAIVGTITHERRFKKLNDW